MDDGIEDPAKGVLSARSPGQLQPAVHGRYEVVEYLDQAMVISGYKQIWHKTAEQYTIWAGQY